MSIPLTLLIAQYLTCSAFDFSRFSKEFSTEID